MTDTHKTAVIDPNDALFKKAFDGALEYVDSLVEDPHVPLDPAIVGGTLFCIANLARTTYGVEGTVLLLDHVSGFVKDCGDDDDEEDSE